MGAVGGAATTPSRGYYGYGYNEPGYYSYCGPTANDLPATGYRN